MVCVGGSVAVSGVLARAPVFTAEALRYARGVPDPAGPGPADRPAAGHAAGRGVAVAVGHRRDRPGAVQRGAGGGVAARRAGRSRRGGGLRPLAAGRDRAAAGGIAAARGRSRRRPGRDLRRRAGPGPGPHRRRRGGLGRGGVRLRGRVHPAGHPGPGPARPVGGVGAHHLDRGGDLRRDRAGARGPGCRGPPGHRGLAGRRLSGRGGDGGGLRHVVFQRETAGRRPGRPAHRRGPGGRRGGRCPARRPGAPPAGLGRHRGGRPGLGLALGLPQEGR